MQNIDTATAATVAEARRRLDLLRGFTLRAKSDKERTRGDECLFTGVVATRDWACGATIEHVPIMRTPAKDVPLLPVDVRKLLVAWPPVTDGEKQWSQATGHYFFYNVAPTGAAGANVRYDPHYDADTLDIVAARGLCTLSFVFLFLWLPSVLTGGFCLNGKHSRHQGRRGAFRAVQAGGP